MYNKIKNISMKLKFLKVTTILMASIFLFSSCATIFTKTTYPLAVNTEPSGAKVVITNKKGIEVFRGETPTSLKLKSSNGFFSKAEYSLKFTLPGYKEKTVTVSSSIDGWYWANILLGGVIGMLIVDPATGAMWKLDKEHINETLYPSSIGSIDNPELRILDINNIPADWKEYLVKLN